ncbi:MAG: pyridoxamine 5'-phosphate oxidase family protein [Nitrospirae bacterium]|nr:pyridoxamine 5'-phosphate oxidase family protein [Candidatus Manganitrophaceae bacterium]
MSDIYREGHRKLQDQFDTRRLADRLDETIVRDGFDEEDVEFIRSLDMFFLATVDDRGNPTCSYKAGAPGFVRVVDSRTLAFPNYDGNGMYLSMGNIQATGRVGMLFIDFENQSRMRVQGEATIDPNDPLLSDYPEAQFIVRVHAREVFPNCPRYIHQMTRVKRSDFVPKTGCETPVPAWKTREWVGDALPAEDPARDPSRKTLER